MKKYKEFITEAKDNKKLMTNIAKDLKNDFDYNNKAVGAGVVKAANGKLKIAEPYFYGGADAQDDLIKSWDKGGEMHEYFKEKYGVTTRVTDHNDWTYAKSSPYKSQFDDGVVEVTVDLI